MTRSLAYALLIVCLCSSSTPRFSLALAQGATIDRDSSQIDRRSRREFDRSEAIHIARLSGVARVRNVDRRGRYWIVLGEPRRGRDLLNVRIDARTGRVVGMNRLRR
jgi:hypothetical protein